MTATESVLAIDALDRMRQAAARGEDILLTPEDSEFVLEFLAQMMERESIPEHVTIWEGGLHEDSDA